MSFISFFRRSDKEFEELNSAVRQIIGSKPNNPELYQLAFRHSSASEESYVKGYKESNERLEYLGDAVLGFIVGEYLFRKYPFKDEGFLTEIRSRIVKRDSLNKVGRKLGLDELIKTEGNKNLYRSSVLGDAMEAFIGAIYLDKGFKFTRRFVINELISNYYDIDDIIANNTNYKSILLTWGQAEGKKIEFVMIEERGKNHYKEFVVKAVVDSRSISQGNGWNKKKAEQDAARRACEALEIEQ